ncbi:MAG: GNAT family N-acetyltransferase [Acidimicrobiales bacterium]
MDGVPGLRLAGPDDIARIVELNTAAVPAVSLATPERMAELVDMAELAWVVDGGEPGELAAFVLLFAPGSAYDSRNYAWFSDRYDDFLYVDRIVVAPEHRGSGLGGRLYEAVIAETRRRGARRVTAEVNLRPPNPGSSRFHRRLGFEAAGSQEHGDDYEVEMLVRPV